MADNNFHTHISSNHSWMKLNLKEVWQYRDLIYLGTLPGWGIVTAGCVTAVVALLIGIWSFGRSQDKFILYI